MNAEKTQIICFTRKKSSSPINIILFNSALKLINEVTFLRALFDLKFIWATHLNFIEATMFRRTKILRSFAGQNWGTGNRDWIHI